jgi:4-oxalocrotonate tautomerase family enzyme
LPVVKIDLLAGRTKEQKEKLFESILKAFEENNIPREWVTIILNDSPIENWIVDGEPLSKKMKK